MTERKYEVDERGNCSKCGGTHYGTGRMCPMPPVPPMDEVDESWIDYAANLIDQSPEQMRGLLAAYKTMRWQAEQKR